VRELQARSVVFSDVDTREEKSAREKGREKREKRRERQRKI
jgi:hypothetical protein